jgi:SAM-dependent methyltransferase
MSDQSANAEQVEYWNAEEAVHWVVEQDRYDGMLAPFGARLLDAAALQPGDRVLDVGCGTGQTTCGAGRRVPDGTALGIDISRSMVEAARRRAASEGLAHVTFEVADAQTHAFTPESVDVALSRFGVMFFDDPVAAFANMRHALRDGGRFVFVCWQDLLANEWMAVPGMAAAQHVPLPDIGAPGAPGPFAFGDAAYVGDILQRAGYRDVSLQPVHEPILLGGGGSLDDAAEFLRGTGMARRLFADAPPDAVDRAVDAVTAALAAYVTPDGVRLGSAVWLVTATR